MNFSPAPFEPTNFSALGMLEEDMELRVRDMVSDLKYKYGLCVPAYIVTEELYRREIPYEQLPQYIIDIIDTLEVY